MSDNTEIVMIFKRNNLWDVYHRDTDGGFNHKVGKGFKDLEEAVDFAYKWEKEYYEGFTCGVEYGIRVIKEK